MQNRNIIYKLLSILLILFLRFEVECCNSVTQFLSTQADSKNLGLEKQSCTFQGWFQLKIANVGQRSLLGSTLAFSSRGDHGSNSGGRKKSSFVSEL